MRSVLRHYDLPLKFPSKVLQEVLHFGAGVTRRDLGGRKDCRKAPELGEATQKSKSAPKRKATKPADPATKREKGSTKRRKRAENQEEPLVVSVKLRSGRSPEGRLVSRIAPERYGNPAEAVPGKRVYPVKHGGRLEPDSPA